MGLFKKWTLPVCRQAGFVTICTKNKERFFGNIINKQMVLNNIGKIIEEEWLNTEKIRKNVLLDEWIIMPDHFHGIIVINNNCRNEATPRFYTGKHPEMSKISPKPNSLSSIIGSFKSKCTKQIHKINPNFAWQPRFYDHIIRNEKELNNIRKYIYYNFLKHSKK